MKSLQHSLYRASFSISETFKWATTHEYNLHQDGDSDSERVVTSLVDGPAALLRYEEDEDDGDEEDDTEDEYGK